MRRATVILPAVLVALLLISGSAFSWSGIPLSFGVDLGAYRSNLDYWENRFYKYGRDEEFGMRLLYGGNLRFGITENIIGRADFAYWTGKVELKDVNIVGYLGDETTTINIVPLTVSAVYYFPLRKLHLSPYMGIGGGFYYVSSKVERTTLIGWKPPTYSSSALGFGTHLLGGLEIGPFMGISLTAEYRYTFGQVSQKRLGDRGIPERHQVSLSGPQIFVGLNYALGDLLRPRAAVPAYVPPAEIAPKEAERVLKGTESELERIRREREKAEKELEELRKLLEESRKK